MIQDKTVSNTQTQEPDLSLRRLLIQLLGYLSRRRRLQLCALLLVMITSSVAEVLSLASVLPFLAVLANPDELWNQAIIQQWSPVFGISNASGLLLPLTLIFALLSLLAGGIRLLNLWLNCRLAAAIGSDLSCDSFRRTLFQPYLVHVNRNSSQLSLPLVPMLIGSL